MSAPNIGIKPPAGAPGPESSRAPTVPAAAYAGRCADASARRAAWRTPSSQAAGLVAESRPGAPWKPLTGPAARGRPVGQPRSKGLAA